MRAQLIAALSVSVGIGGATPVELRTSFAEAQNRFVVQPKVERAGLRVRTKLLNQPSVFRFHEKGRGVGRELHYQPATKTNCSRACQARNPGLGARPGPLRQRTVVRKRLRPAVDDWRNTQPHGRGAD